MMMTPRRQLRAAPAALLIAVAVTGCGSSSSDTTGAAAAKSAIAVIKSAEATSTQAASDLPSEASSAPAESAPASASSTPAASTPSPEGKLLAVRPACSLLTTAQISKAGSGVSVNTGLGQTLGSKGSTCQWSTNNNSSVAVSESEPGTASDAVTAIAGKGTSIAIPLTDGAIRRAPGALLFATGGIIVTVVTGPATFDDVSLATTVAAELHG